MQALVRSDVRNTAPSLLLPPPPLCPLFGTGLIVRSKYEEGGMQVRKACYSFMSPRPYSYFLTGSSGRPDYRCGCSGTSARPLPTACLGAAPDWHLTVPPPSNCQLQPARQLLVLARPVLLPPGHAVTAPRAVHAVSRPSSVAARRAVAAVSHHEDVAAVTNCQPGVSSS